MAAASYETRGKPRRARLLLIYIEEGRHHIIEANIISVCNIMKMKSVSTYEERTTLWYVKPEISIIGATYT